MFKQTGVANPTVTDGHRAAVDACLRRGWTIEQLALKATAAADRHDPTAYWRQTLAATVNTDPPRPDHQAPATTPAPTRPLEIEPVDRTEFAALDPAAEYAARHGATR